MHELAVTESLLAIALRKAGEANASRITDMTLVIGDLASFVDDSIAFYWDIISAGTIAEGATLTFRRMPARLHCKECDTDYTPPRGELLCPNCGGAKVTIIGGEEFFLESIGIESQPNENTE